MIFQGPTDNMTAELPALPTTGPLEWWHRLMGVIRMKVKRGQGIRVGVTDTGCGPHQCLSHVTDAGAFIDGQVLPGQGADVDSHGSHVCGIVAARPQSTGQYSGISPGVRLYSARVFPPGRGANQGDIANAIDALSKTHEVDLINMSLGSPQASQIERDAIQDALERGTLCVCAAANSNGPVEYPAAFPECVAVSALGLLGWGPSGSIAASRVPQSADRFGNENLYLANFSCFGPEIDCAAPGVGIISTVPARFGLQAPYASMDGTSMASPVACGTLAALLGASSEYKAMPRNQSRAEKARSIMRDACRDIGLKSVYQGRGVPKIG